MKVKERFILTPLVFIVLELVAVKVIVNAPPVAVIPAPRVKFPEVDNGAADQVPVKPVRSKSLHKKFEEGVTSISVPADTLK